VGEETSADILCECEALASHSHAYLGSFFLDQEDIRSLGLGSGGPSATLTFRRLMSTIVDVPHR